MSRRPFYAGLDGSRSLSPTPSYGYSACSRFLGRASAWRNPLHRVPRKASLRSPAGQAALRSVADQSGSCCFLLASCQREKAAVLEQSTENPHSFFPGWAALTTHYTHTHMHTPAKPTAIELLTRSPWASQEQPKQQPRSKALLVSLKGEEHFPLLHFGPLFHNVEVQFPSCVTFFLHSKKMFLLTDAPLPIVPNLSRTESLETADLPNRYEKRVGEGLMLLSFPCAGCRLRAGKR